MVVWCEHCCRVRKELEESKLDIEGLRKLLELKTRELRKIKVIHSWIVLIHARLLTHSLLDACPKCD